MSFVPPSVPGHVNLPGQVRPGQLPQDNSNHCFLQFVHQGENSKKTWPDAGFSAGFKFLSSHGLGLGALPSHLVLNLKSLHSLIMKHNIYFVLETNGM